MVEGNRAEPGETYDHSWEGRQQTVDGRGFQRALVGEKDSVS